MKKSTFVKLVLLQSVVWLLPSCTAREDQDPKDRDPGGQSGGRRGVFIFPIVTRHGPARVAAPVASVASAGVRPGGAVRSSVVRGGFGRSGVAGSS